MFVACDSFSQSHLFLGVGGQCPLLGFQCGFLVCAQEESAFPGAISHSVCQTSELPVSSFPVSLVKSAVEFGLGLKTAHPSPPTRHTDARRKSAPAPGVSAWPSSALRGRQGPGCTFTRSRKQTERPLQFPKGLKPLPCFVQWNLILDLTKLGILLSARTGSPSEEAFPDHSHCGNYSSSRNAGWEASRNSK